MLPYVLNPMDPRQTFFLLNRGYSWSQIQEITNTRHTLQNHYQNFPFLTNLSENSALYSLLSVQPSGNQNGNSGIDAYSSSQKQRGTSISEGSSKDAQISSIKVQERDIQNSPLNDEFCQKPFEEKKRQCLRNGRDVQGAKKSKAKKITKKQKKMRQNQRNQTDNSKRNVLPNEIHQTLSVLFKKKKSYPWVEKLIARFGAQNSQSPISTQRFFFYQRLLKERVNHYANKNTLKNLLKPLDPECLVYEREEQKVYSRIGMILVQRFLDCEAAVNIFSSQRISQTNRLDHLRVVRELKTVLSQIAANSEESFGPTTL